MAKEIKLLKKQTHGTIACYLLTRCRCDECKESWRLYTKKRRLNSNRALINGLEIKHSYYGYNFYGCRCEICRLEAKKIKEKAIGKEPPKHGTFSSYSDYRCRCRICKDFKTESMRKYREAKRASIRTEKISMS